MGVNPFFSILLSKKTLKKKYACLKDCKEVEADRRFEVDFKLD